MDEQKLRQLFKNRSNCYADADEVIQAMDEDCFIETVNEALHQPAGVEQIVVELCESCQGKGQYYAGTLIGYVTCPSCDGCKEMELVGRSEQLPCDVCGGKIDKEDKFTDEKHCENCGWF